ncbi:hypothetical protein M7I_2386 [Glarea lozoyensis 74030]|uniref:Uncharacterized protein n=1 Tax=Glarea lozoyensis (strain ATCC 74030 / MF5533) TaxID=1104152 RepID=H0EIM6_GLAL7|nr:hypothetical protein M7I_2386 [Glarea lozoyensis 74030]
MQHKQTGGSQNVRLFLLATKLRPGIKWYPQTVEFYLGNEGEIGQRKMKPRTDLQYLAQDKKAIEKFVEVLKLCLGIQSIRTNVLPKLLNLRTLEARFDSPRIPIAALKLPYLKTLIFHYMDDEWTQAVGSTHRDSDDSPSPKRRTETPWRWARTGAITTLRLYIDADLPVLYEKIFIWPIALSHLSIHGGSTPYGYDKAALERILNPHRDTLQTIELPDICNGLPDLSTFKRLTHLTFPAWRFITLDDSSKPSTRPSKPSKEPTPSPSTLLPSSLKILTLPFPSHCYQSPPRYVQNPPAFTAETSDWFIAFAETRQETSSDARYKIILNYDVFRGRAYVSRSDKRKVIGWPWTQLERAKEGAREFGVELEFEASISKAEWFEMGMAKDIWESNGLELGRLFLGEE